MATDQVADSAAPHDEGYPAGRVGVRAGAATVFFGAAALYVVREAAPLLVPIFLSLLIAYALEPFVAALIRLRLPRAAAATIVCFTLSMALGVGMRAARPQVVGFLDDLPGVVASLGDIIRQHANDGRGPGPLEHVRSAAREIDAAVSGGAQRAAPGVARVRPVPRHSDVGSYLVDAGRSAALMTVHGLVIALLTFLLLATGDTYTWKIVRIAGPRLEKRKVTLDVLRAIDRQVQRYLVARLWISGFVAVATGAGLWSLDVAHAWVWGGIAGVLNVLPFIGPAIAIVLIALAAFVQHHTVGITVSAVGIATLVAAIEGNLLTPWLAGRAGELNTVSVFVAVLFWGWMWDVWGLLLAIPIMVAIKAAADHIEPLRPLGELLGR